MISMMNQISPATPVEGMHKGKNNILTRQDLIVEQLKHLPESPTYRNITFALTNNCMPFYTDPTTLQKYSLFAWKILGGGTAGIKERGETGYAVLSLKDGSSLTISQKGGELSAFIAFLDNTYKESNHIIINGVNVKEMADADRANLIPLFQQMSSGSLLEVKYESVNDQILINSRQSTKTLMLEGPEKSKIQTELAKRYSIIETLDEDYVTCGLETDPKKLNDNITKFIQKYETTLEQAQCEEERVDVLIRKATVEGLKINLISKYRFDLLGKATYAVIELFTHIEKEIRLLKLSLEARESLDFHLYRGFVYSKFPPNMYPEQRKIAISDAMIMIHSVEKMIKDGQIQPTPIFYKKVAYACRVFAKGVNNPSVSLKFVSLGHQFVDQSQTKKNDSILSQLKKEFNFMEQEFKKTIVEIDLKHIVNTKPTNLNDTIPANSTQPDYIENHIESMEKIDKILFRTFQDIGDKQQLLSNLQRSMTAYETYMSEEKGNEIPCFRARLRYLFLKSYLVSLNFKNIDQALKSFELISKDFEKLAQKIPKDEQSEAEFHGFRGCVFISYPRYEGANEYDLAIGDFNRLGEMGTILHNDLLAFQYMTYGKSMLNYDPIHAVELLKKAVEIAYCETVKKESQKVLNDFFKSFQPIHPSIEFNTNTMITF